MTNRRLVELHRVAQIGLEAHRHDPDDEATWQEYAQTARERDTEWERHELDRLLRG